MSEQPTGITHTDVGGGVVLDLAKVPDHGPEAPTGGLRLQSTGEAYALEDGTRVARSTFVADDQA